MSDAFDLLSKTELARRRAPLLARIHRRYKTAEETFSIGPLRLAFTRVADPNVVLDEVCAEEDTREKTSGDRHNGNDLHLPYWAELWDSSVGVGWWLVKNRDGVGSDGAKSDGVGSDGAKSDGVGSDGVTAKRRSESSRLSNSALARAQPLRHTVTPYSVTSLHTLDLGCGMGLAGTVAAAMGHDVLFADLETPALLFAKLNSLPYWHHVRLRKLNWQRDRLGEKFDLILGADVLYEKAQWEYLEPFWREHLADGGTILLGEPARQTGDQFGDWIAARGWRMEVFSQKVSTRATPIRLFQLNREQIRMTKPE